MKSKKIIIQNDYIKDDFDKSVYPCSTSGILGFYFPNHPNFGFELVSADEESIILKVIKNEEKS